MSALRENPIVGSGLGRTYRWMDAYGTTEYSTYTLEAWTSIFADYGVLAGLGLYLFLVLLVVEGFRRRHKHQLGEWSMIALGCTTLIYARVSSPFDDKGLFLALFVIGIAGRDHLSPIGPPPRSGGTRVFRHSDTAGSGRRERLGNGRTSQ